MFDTLLDLFDRDRREQRDRRRSGPRGMLDAFRDDDRPHGDDQRRTDDHDDMDDELDWERRRPTRRRSDFDSD